MMFWSHDAITISITIPMELPVVLNIDASTSTSTGTKRSYYIFKKSSQQEKCCGVIDSTISIM